MSNTCGEVAAQATCQLLVVPDVSVSQLSIFLGSTSGTATVESEDGDTTAAAVDVVEYSVGDDYPIGSTTTKIGSLDPIDPLLNLIVDASDQSKMRFSSHKAKIAIKSVIDGFENTKAIVDANVQVGYQADYPADECYKRPLLNGEYSFLPALEQLRAVLKNCSIIGQCIEHEDYWTSTEAPSSFDSETYVLRPDEPDRNDEDGWKAENIYRCVYAIADE
ncbi:MAG: hypothetical protein K0U37_02200 [Gammaproteobacteria bacterium]|nr:hypothetical protein [Gammaproteobacteria bacterium]